LSEEGFVDGRNVAVQQRWAEGRDERLRALLADLLSLNAAVIVANTIAALAAKAAGTTIPVVFTTGSDPVRDGLVASLSRPGGNFTGVAFLSSELGTKRLDLLRQLAPKASTIAVLHDGGYGVARSWGMSAIRSACWSWARCRPRPVRSDSSSRRLKSDGRRILRPPWTRLKAARTHSMSVKTCSRGAAGCASTPWRWPRACRWCTALGSSSKRRAQCPTRPTFPLCTRAPPTMPTRVY